MNLVRLQPQSKGGGSDIKPYEVQFTCDSGYIGQTMTMTYKGTESVDSVSDTVGSDGKLTLYPMHSGTWECDCYSTVRQSTMKKNIDLNYWGVTNVSFEDTPNGATVTPINDVQIWLHCANIWDKSYTTITEVLSDTTTLNTLLSDNNASDYLVRSTTFSTSICSSETAMQYIGLNNNCANKLLSDNTWCTAICNSTFFEKILNVKVPTLSTYTASTGETSFGNDYIGSLSYPSYFAFDGIQSVRNSWICANNARDNYIGIDFKKNVSISKVELVLLQGGSSNMSPFTMTLQGFNGTTWENIETLPTISAVGTYNFPISKLSNYQKVRLHTTDYLVYNSQWSWNFTKVQFYGREVA